MGADVELPPVEKTLENSTTFPKLSYAQRQILREVLYLLRRNDGKSNTWNSALTQISTTPEIFLQEQKNRTLLSEANARIWLTGMRILIKEKGADVILREEGEALMKMGTP